MYLNKLFNFLSFQLKANFLIFKYKPQNDVVSLELLFPCVKSLARYLFWWGDVFADGLYACDICVQLRTAYRDDHGIMVREI